ncbi:hypothetical protein MPSEU_000527300 [Mayamaea pseudoterrestris]|nr:hypothetical protein MPSEU_000527300 [Mayamaea pseudoterrestris]
MTPSKIEHQAQYSAAAKSFGSVDNSETDRRTGTSININVEKLNDAMKDKIHIKNAPMSATAIVQQRRLEAKREYNRKNAALTRRRTKAQIEDLQSQLNESTSKNSMLTQINAELVGQLEMLTQENVALRQRLSISNLQSVAHQAGPFLSSTSLSWPIDSASTSSMALGLVHQRNASTTSLLASHFPDPLSASSLFPSSIGSAGALLGRHERRESQQNQLLHALLLQQERDKAGLRDHMYDKP